MAACNPQTSLLNTTGCADAATASAASAVTATTTAANVATASSGGGRAAPTGSGAQGGPAGAVFSTAVTEQVPECQGLELTPIQTMLVGAVQDSAGGAGASGGTQRYRCRARCVRTPAQLRDVSRAVCHACESDYKVSELHEPEPGDEKGPGCPGCGAALKFVFMFEVDLQDDTGTLPVILFHEDAVRDRGNAPPRPLKLSFPLPRCHCSPHRIAQIFGFNFG